MQYGQTIEVQPAIWALGEAADVARIEYRLWDGECSSCECDNIDDTPFQEGSFGSEECQSKVLAIREGANALDHVTLDPTIAPFVSVTDGYQAHVLTVTVWDECGNSTTDCVTLYILDITPTDAIIIDPMNHDVFCQDHEQDGGGIEITATSLLNDRIKQVIFYYRPAGETEWTVIDSAEVGRPGGPRFGTTGEVSVLWYPHALGLPDGTYELKAVAMDYSLNKQTTEYITTVHLSCADPTVTMTDPTPGDGFLGDCEVELTAQAVPGDEVNDITEVCFYYMEWTDDEPTSIGCDYNPDGSNGQTMFNYAWTPSDNLPSSGHYYLWATATNKAGVTVESEKVLVKYDGSNPWARVIEVAGDGSDGRLQQAEGPRDGWWQRRPDGGARR